MDVQVKYPEFSTLNSSLSLSLLLFIFIQIQNVNLKKKGIPANTTGQCGQKASTIFTQIESFEWMPWPGSFEN